MGNAKDIRPNGGNFLAFGTGMLMSSIFITRENENYNILISCPPKIFRLKVNFWRHRNIRPQTTSSTLNFRLPDDLACPKFQTPNKHMSTPVPKVKEGLKGPIISHWPSNLPNNQPISWLTAPFWPSCQFTMKSWAKILNCSNIFKTNFENHSEFSWPDVNSVRGGKVFLSFLLIHQI